MDRILVMADGKIVQTGTWFELKQIDGEFRRLLTRRQKEAIYA
jgi:ABC-type transport system involved in cytochrome bd biosynthesis fused ATPase/permease subunit